MTKPTLLFFFLFITFGLYAQDTLSVQTKPKIGLVLSGGGAKGLAHIGVLKVLEEQGVEISYITGTSMGAIIGGLYASGFNAAQLDSIFKTVDANALVQDYVPRMSKSFYERRDDEIYALQLPFDNFKIGMPQALSKGMYNYNLLTRLTYHVKEINDFSKLPIPFACIATDIETGKEVVLNKGKLAQSIIASGAFPSLFSPVEIDGKILIDGGVVNNYPVELVRKMGADIVIGVDVQDELKTRKDLGGAMGVLLQTTNFPMIEQMQKKRLLTDIYIKPDIKGFNVVSFDLGDQIIPRGEEAANEVLNKIRIISSDYENKKVIANYISPSDSLLIGNILVDEKQLKYFNEEYVVGKLNIKPFRKVAYQQLEDGIASLNATQNFQTINYEFKKNPYFPNYVDIDFTLSENPVERYLKFGLHYDGVFKSSALINITQKKLIFTNDVVSLDVILGDNNRYNFRYYWDNGASWSVGVNSKLTAFGRNIPYQINTIPDFQNVDITKIAYDYKDLSNQLYVQTFFKSRYLIGLGLEHKYLKLKSNNINNQSIILEKNHYLNGLFTFKYDTYDNKYFPKKGVMFNGEYKHFFLSSESNSKSDFPPFSIVKGDLGIAQGLTKKLTLKLESELGIMLGPYSTPFLDFIIGGYGFAQSSSMRHFYGYNHTSLVGNNYIKALIDLDYEFLPKHHLNASANFANIGHDILESGKLFSTPKYDGYAVGYGYQTILGPIELKHSWSPNTSDHFTWVSVGFWF